MRRKIFYIFFICTACLFFALITAYALWDQAVWPEASGDVVLEDSYLEVDASHASDGYIMVRVKDGNGQGGYKVNVAPANKKDNSANYDLEPDGEWHPFPLRGGDGTYKVQLYKQKSGKSYTNGGQVKFEAKLASADAPYLVSNPYVDYTRDTEAVKISDVLCMGLATDREKFEAVCNYINLNYNYDYDRAKEVSGKQGILPDIDYCVTNKMGICQDLSATVACMLRVQGIPTKIVIGYTGRQYHAWNLVMLDGEEILYDATAEIIPGAYTGQRTVERIY